MHDEERTKSWRVDGEGHLIHDGDCHAWSWGICTCGLIHHLLPKRNAEQLMPDYWPQRGRHEEAVHKITCIDMYGEWPVSQETVDRLRKEQDGRTH